MCSSDLEQLAEHQKNQAEFLDMVMPFTFVRKLFQLKKNEGEELAPVENRDTYSEDAINESLGIKPVEAFTSDDASQVIKAFEQAEFVNKLYPLTKEKFIEDSVVDTSNENPFSEANVTPVVEVGDLSFAPDSEANVTPVDRKSTRLNSSH